MKCHQLLVLMIFLVSTLTVVAFAQAEVRQTLARPEVIIPFMKKAPTIDGIISEQEYPTLRIATLVAGNQQLARRRNEFWLGSEGKLLYLAFRTEVNPTYGMFVKSYPSKGKRDAGALFGGIFGMVHEDMVDFWLDNSPGQKEGQCYRVAINPLGAIFDCVYDHIYSIPVNGWRVVMQQAHHMEGNVWTVELAIDPKSCKLHDLRTPFSMRINRFFTLPDDYAHWENSSYARPDFPGMGVQMPQTMPLIRFVDVAPIVKEVSIRDTDGIHLALDVSNPGAQPLPLRVTLGYAPEQLAYSSEVHDVMLAAGETQRLLLQRPFLSEKNYLAHGLETVTSPDGQLKYFTRDFSWQTKPGGPMWDDKKPAPADPIAKFEIEFHPTPKVLRWRVDISANPQKRAITAYRVRVVDTKTNAFIAESSMKAPVNAQGIGQVLLVKLKAGRYQAQLFLDQGEREVAPAKVVIFNYETDFPWLNNTLGISTEVIPPFTPITLQGKTVGTVLRQHTMTDSGLWAQVMAKGQPLLTTPMRFEVKQGGKVQTVQSQLTIVGAKKHRLVTAATWTAGALQGKTISDYDYDGCMKVTLKLSQHAGTKIQGMELVIPINNALAPLFHENGDGLRYNEAGYLPKGEGIIWRSDQASKSLLVGTFIPYLWVGGEERGLCWFASNDKDWVVDCTDTVPDIVLERTGNTLNMRLRLIQMPTTLTREHTIVFGLQATPTRPMPASPADWRSFGYGSSKTFNWGWVGMCPYYGCPYYALRPLNGDYTFIQQCALAKKSGKYDKEYTKNYITAHPEWKNELIAGLRRGSGNPTAAVPYTNIRGEERHSHEWITYQDEWKSNSFPGWDMFEGWGYERKPDYTGEATSAAPEGIDFTVRLTKSRRDYMLYMYKKFFDNGFDGIYWDNTYIVANDNPVDPDVYTRPDGLVQPSTDIWEMRDLFKRTAVLLYQMGKPNANMAHMTNSYIVPMMSWVGFNLDWEWRYGPEDFQDRVPRDYTRAATMGRQAGSVPAILDGVRTATEEERLRVERTRTGMLAVHELTGWQSDLPTTRYLWTIGYGTKECQVYNYWDENPIVKISNLDAEFLVVQNNKSGKTAIVVTDFGGGGAGILQLDTKRLGLPVDFIAINQEHPEQQTKARNGMFQFAIAKHDYQIFEITSR